MKKIFGLIVFLALASVTFASAEVFPTLDVDVGVELVSSFDSVSADVTLEVLNFDSGQKDTFVTSSMTLVSALFINNTFFVPDYPDLDLHRRYLYIQPDAKNLDKPPTKNNDRLSSCSLFDNQVSLRA